MTYRPTRPDPAWGGAACVIVAVVLTAAACGESPTGGEDDPPSVAVSSSVVGFSAVRGGPDPSRVTVEVSNAGGGSVNGLSATVEYEPGQATGWLTASLTATAAPASLHFDAVSTGLSPGTHEADVVVSSGSGGSRTIAVTLVLAFGTAPTVVVTSPARASMLETGTYGESDIRIEGTACHDSVPIAALSVNGEDVPVSGSELCESFDVLQSSAWGLSIIEVRAETAFGHTEEVVQSYLRSPEYQPAAFDTDPTARVSNAAVSQLNQPVLDDADRGDVDDLATLAEAVVNDLDLNELLLNPLISGSPGTVFHDCLWPLPDRTNQASGFNVSRTGPLVAGPRTVGVVASSAGLDLTAALGRWNVPLRVDGYFDGGCFLPNLSASVTGSIGADDVSGDAVLDVVEGPGGLSWPVTVGSVRFDALEIDVDWSAFSFIDWLVDGVVNVLIPVIQGDLEEVIVGQLNQQLPELVQDFFESLGVDEVARVNGFDLEYDAQLEAVDFGGTSGTGYAQAALAMQVLPSGPTTVPAAPFGAPRIGGEPPSFSTVGYDFGVALSDDLVNQVMWAAWQAGAFALDDVSAFTGETYPGLDGGVTPRLPPVVTVAAGAHTVDVQWGDLEWTGLVDPAHFGEPGFQTGDPVPVVAFASATVGVDIDFDLVDALTVFDLAPSVRVQVDIDPGATTSLDEAAVAAALEGVMSDAIVRLVPAAIESVPIPALKIGGLPGAAPDAVLRLENGSLAREGRYLVLTGSVGN